MLFVIAICLALWINRTINKDIKLYKIFSYIQTDRKTFSYIRYILKLNDRILYTGTVTITLLQIPSCNLKDLGIFTMAKLANKWLKQFSTIGCREDTTFLSNVANIKKNYP